MSLTSTTLSPFAPEYQPIPPGVTPTPHGPLPFRLSPPSPTASPPPPPSSFSSLQPPLRPPQPPLFLSTQIFTYIVPQAPFLRHPFPTNHRATSPNPSPPAGAEAAPGRFQRRWSSGGKEGRWSNSGDDGRINGRGKTLKIERRANFNNEKKSLEFERDCKFSSREMQRRHEVMPLKREEEKTTVMIKNIPYDFSREGLINLLDGFCFLENEKARNEGASSRKEAEEQFTCGYDFLYLPIDFRTKRSRGFAFVNFTNATFVWKFYDAFNMKQWDFDQQAQWTKRIEIARANIQGKENLVKHFLQSRFECESKEFLPVCFNPPRDGSGQPVELTVIGNRIATSRWEHRNNHKA